jgi:hypothetical protein
MTREAAILNMVALFKKDREIDEGKVIRHLEVLLDNMLPGDEWSFDERERERARHIAKLDPMSADELEVVLDSIRALERIAPD